MLVMPWLLLTYTTPSSLASGNAAAPSMMISSLRPLIVTVVLSARGPQHALARLCNNGLQQWLTEARHTTCQHDSWRVDDIISSICRINEPTK